MNTKMPPKLMTARLRAITLRPYYAAALFALIPLECPSVGTMAVDKRWRLYWAPEFVNEHTVDELAGVLVHEVEHLLRDHCVRIGARHHIKWNIAADLEINDDIIKDLPLPAEVLTPKKFGLKDGLFAEEYFELVKVEIVELPGFGDEALPGQGQSGSCADGKSKPWESKDGEGGGKDSPPGIDRAEGNLIRRRVADSVMEHAAKSRGTVPGGVKRWAEQFVKSQVSWRTELRTLVRSAIGKVRGMSDYSYRRPSRRQGVAGNVILPSMVDPTPRVAIIVDTSGSMSDQQLAQGLAEVDGVLAAIGQRDHVTVLSVDAAVSVVKSVFSARQVELFGGGGTDMRTGIEAASQLRPRPEVIIVFTDGYTPWPDQAPKGAKVVVCVCTEDGSSPAWARTVRIPMDDSRRRRKH